MTDEPTQVRVYRLLAAGRTIPSAAEALKLARQTVHAHALRLERLGAIRRQPGARAPVLYGPGPRAQEFEAGAVRSGDRGGRSAGVVPAGAFRVHADGYRFEVLAGPERPVKWDQEWVASGVRNAVLRRRVGSTGWRLWFVEGRRGASLLLQPDAEWVWGSGELAQAGERRRRDADGIAGAFARRFGFRLRSSRGEEVQPAEFALPLVGEWAATGTPGQSDVWIDHSEGEERAELETRSSALAALVADLPRRVREDEEWRAGVLRRLGVVEEEARAFAEAVTRAIEAEAEARRAVSRGVVRGQEDDVR